MIVNNNVQKSAVKRAHLGVSCIDYGPTPLVGLYNRPTDRSSRRTCSVFEIPLPFKILPNVKITERGRNGGKNNRDAYDRRRAAPFFPPCTYTAVMAQRPPYRWRATSIGSRTSKITTSENRH